jgi:putative PIN family toxin of toxin-antitoxin system
MVKVVYDTNIIVSATLHKDGLPALLLSLALEEMVRLLISHPLLAEYEEVLKRPRFSLNPKDVEELISLIKKQATLVKPAKKLQIIRDEADNRILECALKGKANFIVTGNKKHFPFEEFRGVKILTPRKFIDAIADDLVL